MDSQTIQAVFAIAGALVGVAFSTGVFVIFVKLSLKHLENKVDDNYRTLDAKLADSFVALVLRLAFSGPTSVRSRRSVERVRLL